MSEDIKKKLNSMSSEEAARGIAEFFQDAENKKDFMDFVLRSYAEKESESINKIESKLKNEVETDKITDGEYHTAGNISSLVAKDLNMFRSEQAVARGMGVTKDVLDKTLEERVTDIRKLLANIGGFSSQLKSCFARSTVVFYQQDDPQYNYRERLIFSINLPSFELKRSWEESDEEGREDQTSATWDDAVNSLASIIESVGLNAKYCKNDRNYRQFTMKQDLRNQLVMPDEYFSIVLDYINDEKIRETGEAYNDVVNSYDKKIKKLEAKLTASSKHPDSKKYRSLQEQKSGLVQERDFFVATVPDPSQIQEGLLLHIDVSTLKDYHIVKDKMQSVMTKFILHLSQIATDSAEFDPELEYELWKSNSKNKNDDEYEEELYEVDASALQPIKKKAA